MTKYRSNLPQTEDVIFITDGGLETTLIFHHEIDLPEFAAFAILEKPESKKIIDEYYHPYIKTAREYGVGFILETPTWRASKKWGEKLGFSQDDLRRINLQSIDMMSDLRSRFETSLMPMVISGCIGPQGDGYHIDTRLSSAEAEAYHYAQVETFARSDADMVTGLTLTYVEEAVGLTKAAARLGIPVAISFTVETDGRLPSGQPLSEAILQVDEITSSYPVYYMINCAHPDHFLHLFTSGQTWMERIRGVRANASCKSHEELDCSDTLDRGNPEQFGLINFSLRQSLPNLNIFGGCCGTDHSHIEQICTAFGPAVHHTHGTNCKAEFSLR